MDAPSAPLPASPRHRVTTWVGCGALLAILLLSPAAGTWGAPTTLQPSPHVGPMAATPSGGLLSIPRTDPFGLAIGDQVEVVSSTLAVRQAPTSSAALFTVEVQFHQGIIRSGSTLADGYLWWQVSWNDNYTGWSAEGDNGTAWIKNLTGHTVAFDRAGALSYAAEYWGVVTSDGYFWNGPSTYVSYAQGTSVVGLSGDDCAHFVSQVIGNEPNQAGGGLNIPSRVPPTYGEPGNAALGDMILNNGWGIVVNSTNQLEPGDVINYEWTAGGGWAHVADYVGHDDVAAHTNSHFGVNWTLGGAVAYRLIHILATSRGGSGIDHPAVTLALSPSSGSAPLAVSATVAVLGGSGTYASYLFTWGDGTTSTSPLPSASHTYTSAGSYSATVEVIDSLGATGWAANRSVSVTSGGPPPLTVSLSPSATSGAAPLSVTFSATPSGGSGTYASFAWTFGDGATLTTTSVGTTHVYTSAGTDSASVKVTDSSGAVATSASVSIQVSSAPPALTVSLSANVTTGWAPLSVALTASAAGGTGTYSSFAWSFGDGSTLTTATPATSYTYSVAGTFEAEVTVSDGVSHANSSTVAITTSSRPGSPPPPLSTSLAASTPSGTAPVSETFTLTISGGTAPYSVLWNFDDGNASGPASTSALSVTISHTFAGAGTRQVTATVVDAAGKVSVPSVQVSISAAPSGANPSPASHPSMFSELTSGWGMVALIVGLVAVALVLGVVAARRRGRGPQGELATGSVAEFPGYWAGPPPSG